MDIREIKEDILIHYENVMRMTSKINNSKQNNFDERQRKEKTKKAKYSIEG